MWMLLYEKLGIDDPFTSSGYYKIGSTLIQKKEIIEQITYIQTVYSLSRQRAL